MPLALHTVLEPSLRWGLIDAGKAAQVRRDVQMHRADPVRAVSLHGRVPTSAVLQAVASEMGVDFLGREQITVHADLLRRMPRALVERKMVLPISEAEREVLMAIGDLESAGDRHLREGLQRVFGKPVRFALADAEDLGLVIETVLEGASRGARPLPDSAVRFIEDMFYEAFVHRASDVHIEPEEGDEYRVRFRVDGDLRPFRSGVPLALALAVLSRLKVLAELDIAVTREPQDGSLTYAVPGAEDRSFDVRLATAPTKLGERATLRLLGTDTRDLALEALGFPPTMYARFQLLIRRPSGLILLTGPTGSGKTTTLYAALREINRPDLNLMTVEDPVEYMIEGVSQIEVDRVGKVTFSSALRSILRHDPDVLMIGEIRDRETADIALRAAMTGHLVFSTLHTNTAVGAVTRLLDMGCEPYLVAATLAAVFSQRLVRRLCPTCRTARETTPQESAFLGTTDAAREIFEPRGCLRCQRTGFLGRVAACEMLDVDDAVREAIAGGATERQIAEVATRQATLRQDAVAKVLAGVTTLDEAQSILVMEA